MKIEIETLIKDTLYNSLAQSIIKLIRTPYKILKLFIVLSLICTGCLSTYIIIDTLTIFFNREVYTTIRTINEQSSPFPKITLCNYNQFTSKYSVKFIRSINAQVNSSVDIFDSESMKNLNAKEKINLLGEESKKLI